MSCVFIPLSLYHIFQQNGIFYLAFTCVEIKASLFFCWTQVVTTSGCSSSQRCQDCCSSFQFSFLILWRRREVFFISLSLMHYFFSFIQNVVLGSDQHETALHSGIREKHWENIFSNRLIATAVFVYCTPLCEVFFSFRLARITSNHNVETGIINVLFSPII